jgi:hypothetical protein
MAQASATLPGSLACAKTLVDVARFAAAHLVHGGLHVVVDAAPGHAGEYREGVVVGIEQHLVRLQRVRAQ